MISEDPYRWLEAMRNRREYIDDRVGGGKPVVAVGGEPGILLMAARAGTPKIYEVYDRLAIGCLGHPADMEKIRHIAVDAGHMEGFTRSADDVNARRLVNYTLAPYIKEAYEQIFSPPILMRAIMVEVGHAADEDSAWTLDYDGGYAMFDAEELRHGVVISGDTRVGSVWGEISTEAGQPAEWNSLAQHALRLLVWATEFQAQGEEHEEKSAGFAGSVSSDDSAPEWGDVPTDVAELKAKFSAGLEFAVLDRALAKVTYRLPSLSDLGLE